MDITEQAAGTALANTRVDENLKEIFIRHLNANGDVDAGYKAYALMAVEVCLALSNVFLAIKNPKDHRTYRAICDLTFQLNTNDFWQKNANVLLPVVHICLNTYRDGASLMAERTARNEYSMFDTLISASRAAPLELFPLVAYLVGGPILMVSASLPLKHDLAPYFLT